ncbi:hypothetical protein [Pseudoalteromonas sp. OOF1S-7]|uniref:hypothetical protein n=1 Tax=Pseudoalteromonas sp. OOF1S-7 TaxID=2917757 RepID=UPI001EF3D6AD|nr:hypothetical protein [Pseudoalteromonas sp. OOF1S-7]MCG7535660.1 hypothetical protein [Pseudoalteromonas sp. OOF1S-7]
MLRLLSVFMLLLALTPPATATSWHIVSPQITLIAPEPKARNILPNMALIQGNACSALIDSHGDFVALEQLINQLKARLKTPLCHLIATSSSAHQLTGLALLKQAFPDASVHLPTAPQLNEHTMRAALDSQLSNFAKSIELSEQRLSQLTTQQQGPWQTRIALAKQRLARWQTLQSIALRQQAALPAQLELGGLTLQLTQFHGQSGYDLSVFSVQHGALFAGHSVNLLPYVRHTTWQSSLQLIQNTPELDWVMPAFGKPYKAAQLHLPVAFMTLAHQQLANGNTHMPHSITALYQSQPYTQGQLNQHFDQAIKVLRHKKALNK